MASDSVEEPAEALSNGLIEGCDKKWWSRQLQRAEKVIISVDSESESDDGEGDGNLSTRGGPVNKEYASLLGELNSVKKSSSGGTTGDLKPLIWYDNSCHLHAFLQGFIFPFIELGLGEKYFAPTAFGRGFIELYEGLSGGCDAVALSRAFRKFHNGYLYSGGGAGTDTYFCGLYCGLFELKVLREERARWQNASLPSRVLLGHLIVHHAKLEAWWKIARPHCPLETVEALQLP